MATPKINTPLSIKAAAAFQANPNIYKTPPAAPAAQPVAIQAPKPTTTGQAPPTSYTASSVKTGVNMPKVTGAAPMAAPRTNNPAVKSTVINKGAMPMANAAINPSGNMPAMAGSTPSSNGGSMPMTSYGGKGNPLNEILYSKKQYDAGNTAWAQSNAGKFYSQLDPNESAKVKGMNTQQLSDYISSRNVPQGQIPEMPQDQGVMPLNSDEIGAEVDYRLDAESAARQRALDDFNRGMQANRDYDNKITEDNRTLEDGSFYRNNAPAAWDGSAGYRGAMLDRNRSIQDTAVARDYNNEVATANQSMLDFKNLQPQQRNAMINELTRLERDFGLQVGQLTGNYGGERTVQGQGLDLQRDQFGWQQSTDQRDYDRGILESDRGYDYQKGRDQVGDKRYENEFNRDVIESDRNFDRAKYESDRNYQLQVQQQSISSGQWQQQFNMDVEKFGFQQASELWSQAFQENKAGQDDARIKAQLEQELTQADRTAAFQATDAILKSGLVSKTTDMKTGQESMSVTNPKSLSDYIKSLDLSDNATDSLLYQYGLDSYVKK